MKRMLNSITASVKTPVNVVFTEDELIVDGEFVNDVDEIKNTVNGISFGAEVRFFWDELVSKKNTYVLKWDIEWTSWIIDNDTLKNFAEFIEQTYDSDLDEVYDEVEYRAYFSDNNFDDESAVTDAVNPWIEENLKELIEDELDTDKTILVDINGTMSADLRVTEIDVQPSNQFADVDVVYADWAKVDSADYTLGEISDNEYFGW